jgi:hypothetical protein
VKAAVRGFPARIGLLLYTNYQFQQEKSRIDAQQNHNPGGLWETHCGDMTDERWSGTFRNVLQSLAALKRSGSVWINMDCVRGKGSWRRENWEANVASVSAPGRRNAGSFVAKFIIRMHAATSLNCRSDSLLYFVWLLEYSLSCRSAYKFLFGVNQIKPQQRPSQLRPPQNEAGYWTFSMTRQR